MPLFRNVTSSIINFSIFLFYIKKDKRFKFPIFKKKTHENPKKTRELILVHLPFDSIALPSRLSAGREKLGEATFRCNDLIEANRIEASRS